MGLLHLGSEDVAERERWTAGEWQRRYAPTHRAVDACIAQFTSSELTHARTIGIEGTPR